MFDDVVTETPTASPTPTEGPDIPERSPEAPRTPEQAQVIKEELPKDIQTAFQLLDQISDREADSARRGHFRRLLEAEEFWKGNQYPIWSEKEFSFRTPFDYALQNNKLEDQPTYQYVVNIYQATGLTVIAALAQRVPKVRFFPRSAKSEVDIATARAASDISQLIEKNNRLKTMALREAYLLWTQGLFGTWTRFVRDAKKGWEDQPVIENSTVTVSPDSYMCPACGQATEALDTIPGEEACVGCSTPMTGADFIPGETAEVPVVTAIKKVPEGYEKMSVHGALELKVSPYVNDFDACGYLKLVNEVPVGAVRSAYLDKMDEIEEGGSNAGGTNGDADTYEKLSRLKLADAAAPYSGLRSSPATGFVTFKRVWFRRWYFLQHPDKVMRRKLYDMFPNGAFVAFAGHDFLEAYDENVDDSWTLCRAMPGWGMYTEPIGGSTMPLQKQINDGANIVAEHLDYGSAPPILADGEFLSAEGLQGRRTRPGEFMMVHRSRGGTQRSLSDLLYQPNIKIDANVYGYGRSLIELVQVVSGAMPSLFGGQLKGNDTAQAYAQSRDQALGKLQLFWAAVKQHHADVMRQGVECFRRNRLQDVENVILGKSNDYTSRYIRLADLKGNILAEAEADEDFPATWAEIRGNLQELMTSNPELANVLLSEPSNAPVLRKFIASPAIVIPAEDNREKQYREIDELLAAEPIPMMDPMAAPDAMGAPGIKWMPTVMPETHADDHVVHIKTLMEWAVDDEGITAKKMNPAGYANVMAHLLAHKEAMAQVAAFDQNLTAMYGLQPPEAEGGEGPPPKKK